MPSLILHQMTTPELLVARQAVLDMLTIVDDLIAENKGLRRQTFREIRGTLEYPLLTLNNEIHRRAAP